MSVITAENLSKRYYLGAEKANSLRDAITGMFARSRDPASELWALAGVSFELAEGESLGIIGRNGAGKSTLLKILSRITKPTRGRAEIHGRVGSLLEVGTGFHNELTGRENIYLNGAVLGMKHSEIQSKFDEIVAFSELERFLDTPVKHYSSGMYMRLAFSVAAHLEPDVLIVDEVLAVGDAAFQKKSLLKMREAGRSGRTVIFVSHDMQAISRLCGRALWLKDGRIEKSGEASQVVSDYLREQTRTGAERCWPGDTAPGNELVRLRAVRVHDQQGNTTYAVDVRSSVAVEITYEVMQGGKAISPNFQLYDGSGTCLFVSLDQDPEWRERTREAGVYVSRGWIPGNLLAEGSVFVTVVLATHHPLQVHVNEEETVGFHVTDPLEGDSARGTYAGKLHGAVRPLLKWETEFRPQ
jgi:lipopolysaccharide transport system ATP-binding protein